MVTSVHQMRLKVADNKHQWECAQCGRVVSVESGGLTVINPGDSGALHNGLSVLDTGQLGLDFQADFIPPEEKELFDRWSSEF